MNPVLIVFVLSYAGLALGSIPGYKLDRSGIALLGGLAMMVILQWDSHELAKALDFPTLFLLYGLMIISAQFRLGGFYTWVASKTLCLMDRPRIFLFWMMLASALLSALLANDIVCLAFTPVLCRALSQSRIPPIPCLLGLALSSNLGSAMTIVGNPQNMLLGQSGQLDFLGFFLWCTPPALLGLILAWAWLAPSLPKKIQTELVITRLESSPLWPDLNRWQSLKAILSMLLLIGLFLTDIPREYSTLGIAGFLLISRTIHSKELVGLVDWHLLSLFCGLFWIQAAIVEAGILQSAMDSLLKLGLDMQNLYILNTVSIVLSNIVSNVPAVMLLIPSLPEATQNSVAWYSLAVSSTLAGNLILIGSIANLIVVEQAKNLGITISFYDHAKVGIPTTLLTIFVFFLWLFIAG
ncbi:MAG: anion transporter [Candidatus Cloacimonetes bacterium]|nr:anion transporter [Candidatus Cloacimonadota bacterium]